MDIQDIRRANLARWLQANSTPQKEKSLFSQLKNGGSFGERVARRLEVDYDMGVGFLDREVDSKSTNKAEKPPLSVEAEQLISWVKRIDGLGGQAPKVFRNISEILALAHYGALTQNPRAVKDLLAEESSLEAVAYRDPDTATQNATRKRPAKQSG